jgi:putative membrane protein
VSTPPDRLADPDAGHAPQAAPDAGPSPQAAPDGGEAPQAAPAERAPHQLLPPADGVEVDPALAVAAPPAEDSGEQWRRLSVRMLAVHPVMEVIRALPALIGVLFIGVRQGGGGQFWGLTGVGVVVGIGLIRWATTTYRVTEHQVQVRRGLLRRATVTVPRDRVRSVDLTAHFMHRLLGLQRLTIGTGQRDQRKEGDLRLDALTTEAAHRLRDELLHQRTPSARAAGSVPAQAIGPRETELAALRPEWFRYAPFSLYGLFTILITVSIGYRLVAEARLDPSQLGPVRGGADQLSHAPLALAITEVAIALVILIGIFSTVGYLLTFWGFRLTRTDSGTLHVVRGLVTTRAITIEERRLRGVEVGEPALLRLVGGARLVAITTGVRAGAGAVRGGSLLCPPAPHGAVLQVAQRVLGDDPLAAPLARHGRRATRRRYTRALIPVLALIALLVATDWWWSWPAYLWQDALVLVPLAVVVAAGRAASLGHAFTGRFLVARQGMLDRRHSALSDQGVIGWRLEQSFFQRRAGLATLSATTAGGRQRYEVLDVPLERAVRLADAVTPGLLTPFLGGGGSAGGGSVGGGSQTPAR